MRFLSTAWDYVLLILTSAPFVTGFLAYHQIGPYKLTLILHILFAEILLIIIPFSKLGHIVLFFFSRTSFGFEMGRRGARTWLSICASCGLCADSCLFYLAKNKDPRLSPAYKVRATLRELYRRKGEVEHEFLEKCYNIIWGECTTCRRCSLFCTFGIDISVMIATMRGICNSQGIVPEGLLKASDNYRASGNQMGMSKEDFVDTCLWMAEETAEEIRGLQIPIDKPGARIMYTVNACEPMYYPQDIAMAAQIFTVAEEDWTMPSTGWDSTIWPCMPGIEPWQARL